MGIALPLLVGFCSALGLLYVSYSASGAAEHDTGELVALAHQAILDEQFEDLDTDGDGLQDWEEGLWGTDRASADTDGDGTPDNEEILAGRDPLVAGPDDELGSDLASSTAASTTTEVDLTEQLSKNFFGSYLELKQTGQFNDLNKQRLLNSVTQQAAQGAVSPVLPQSAFTRQSGDPDIPEYASAFDQALASVIRLMDEITIAHGVLAGNENRDLYETLQAHAELYDQAVSDLQGIPIPPAIFDEHVQLTNALTRHANMVRALSVVEEDPVRGILALQGAERTYVEVHNSIVSIVNYLAEFVEETRGSPGDQ